MSQRYTVFLKFIHSYSIVIFISPHWCFKSALESILHCQDECG